MNQATPSLSLAGEFPAATREQWLTLVDAVLKGAAFDRLVHTTPDGLRIEPLYSGRTDARPLAGRTTPWQIVQRVDHPDPAKANEQALDDLEGGASGLALICAGAPAAEGFGVAVRSVDDLDQALSRVMLDLISLRIETAPFAGRQVAQLVTALVDKRRLDPASLAIDFGLDPLGDMARSGTARLAWPELSQRAAETATTLRKAGFAKARMLRVDGRVVHDSGGSEAQELAFALASGVAYLRLLEAAGVAPEHGRRMLGFLMTADADQFLTMAKFRALRKLWARVEEACGLKPEPSFISAETAWRMMTQRDVHTNMLRTTIAAFAAGLGGADAVGVLPHTQALGLPDAFARRIARNTQLILLEESNLAKVSDPAAGSGGIETLTDSLCHAAWTLFQEIEGAGGAAEALERGLIQDKVAATRAQRQAAVAQRKDTLTGTTDYPNLSETPATVLDVPHATVPPLPAAKTFPALPRIRLAAPFEKLRDASDSVLARTASRPKIALVNLGTPAEFTARAIFARSFFEAGGIEAVDVAGAPAALAQDFRSSGATLACLCSSDDIYAREAVEAAKALVQAGARHVYLAGRPKEQDSLRQAGVKIFVYSGCDALATLQAAHDILGLSATSNAR